MPLRGAPSVSAAGARVRGRGRRGGGRRDGGVGSRRFPLLRAAVTVATGRGGDRSCQPDRSGSRLWADVARRGGAAVRGHGGVALLLLPSGAAAPPQLQGAAAARRRRDSARAEAAATTRWRRWRERSIRWRTISTRACPRAEPGDRARRQLLADVSHELMTPLTAMRGYIETLGMPGRDRGGSPRSLPRIVMDETQRLESIDQRSAGACAPRRRGPDARASSAGRSCSRARPSVTRWFAARQSRSPPIEPAPTP